jgi:hypothetical protein
MRDHLFLKAEILRQINCLHECWLFTADCRSEFTGDIQVSNCFQLRLSPSVFEGTGTIRPRTLESVRFIPVRYVPVH